MKGLVAMLAVTAVLLAAASDPALARGGRGGGGSHASGGHAAGARSGGTHVKGGQASGRHSSHGRYNGGRSHNHIGAIFGASLFFPSWYFYPPAPAWYSYSLPPEYYYGDPTAYGSPDSPTLYVEQSRAPEAAAQEPAYWYYCAESQTYYPYVEQCPGGWQTVTPQAPSEPAAPSAPSAN